MNSENCRKPSRPHHFRISPQQLLILSLSLSLGAVAALIAGCSGTATTSAGMAQVSVKLSDPATCMAPNGPFAHVFVTVTDVKAHVNGSAADNDPGFVDLTPGLSTKPQQIDLLGQASNHCFLATPGSTHQFHPHNYPQIPIILSRNT